MAANLNRKSGVSIQSQFENSTINERTHAKIERPDKGTNLKQQNQKRLKMTTANSSSRSCGRYKHLHLDDSDNHSKVNSMQMPSMITSGSELWHQQRRKQRLGCLSAGRRAGQANVTRPIRLRFNGNVSLRALLAGLLHQIVIVSLILHKLPASRATRTPPIAMTNVGRTDGNTVEPTTMTFNHHLGDRHHNFNQQQSYLIELPTLIYTDPLRSLRGQRAGQKTTSEQQRPLLQTKELQEGAKNGAIGNNRCHQQEARSFIKASEMAPDDELMQTVRRHKAPPQAQSERHNEAAAADNHHQRHRRAKRHMVPMLDEDSVAMVADAANQYATPPPPQPARTMMTMSKRMTPDCHKLAALWLYLQSSYPMLANHLAELATGTSTPKVGQLARSIGHILDDAERLTAAVTRPQKATISLANQRHSPAWLARISANSVYGKLVQHLRARQMNQLNQQQPSSSGVVPKELAAQEANELAQRQQQPVNSLTNGPDDTNGEQLASSMSQPQSAAATTNSQVVYGRLVNYPHEIGLGADNSHGTARTLEKLRLLNHHSKQQRQQQLASGDIVETNKISLTAADLADQTGADRQKLAESAVDLARNNLVYGTMLLRPSSANDQDKQRSPSLPVNHHHNNHQRPMSTLRELANEQEHQRLMHSGQNQPPIKTATGSGQISFTSSGTNYGRILTSPPSDNKHSNNNNNQNDKSDLTQTTDNSGGDASASDELLMQQGVGLAAAEGGDGDGEVAPSSSNSGDEFEGEFHLGPLKQAEVRLLRSLDHHQQRSSPSGTMELMQQPQLESVTKKADFVID